MMAKSISRGMIAALLFVCAAHVVHASDRSLGSGNGSLGNSIGIRSHGSEDRGRSYSVRRSYPSLFIIGTFIDRREIRDQRRRSTSTTVLAPKAKIIDVDSVAYNNAFAPRNGCVMESGVCVIRGDR